MWQVKGSSSSSKVMLLLRFLIWSVIFFFNCLTVRLVSLLFVMCFAAVRSLTCVCRFSCQVQETDAAKSSSASQKRTGTAQRSLRVWSWWVQSVFELLYLKLDMAQLTEQSVTPYNVTVGKLESVRFPTTTPGTRFLFPSFLFKCEIVCLLKPSWFPLIKKWIPRRHPRDVCACNCYASAGGPCLLRAAAGRSLNPAPCLLALIP